jgi:CHAP domain
MSLVDVVSRVSELSSLAQRAVTPLEPASSFGDALSNATPNASPSLASVWASPYATALPSAPSGSGSSLLAAAESQIGQSEQPPGSNDGPALAEYRSSVAGAAAGEPWCAYFASWAAAQAGTPLGTNGEGLGSVAQIESWGAQTGRLLPASATPQPGDLILYGHEHVGIVESVNADGSLTTVEGNYSNAVSRVHRSPSEATGYVRP